MRTRMLVKGAWYTCYQRFFNVQRIRIYSVVQKYTCETDVWYSEQPRGKHFLNDMLKNMCTEAKLQGGYTNHTLRAYGATELFRHHFPEHVTQQFTGHRSITPLRQYEKVAVEQQKAECNILTGESSNDFNAEV